MGLDQLVVAKCRTWKVVEMSIERRNHGCCEKVIGGEVICGNGIWAISVGDQRKADSGGGGQGDKLESGTE